MRQNPHLNFPFTRTLVNETLLTMVGKTKENYVSSTFYYCNSCTMSFDLWMSKMEVDTFVMIVHFLNDQWELIL
jgi:hypothetical protein